jgi:hypothetical protein
MASGIRIAPGVSIAGKELLLNKSFWWQRSAGFFRKKPSSGSALDSSASRALLALCPPDYNPNSYQRANRKDDP